MHFNTSFLSGCGQRLMPMLLALPLVAAAAPDAGSLLQQLEAAPVVPAVRAPSLKTPPAPTPPAGASAGPVLHVKAFRFEGATLMSAQVLQGALSGFTGRDLSLTQLQEAAWVVTQTYRQAGWLVNAFVPQQEIEQGQVLIRVVEARLGQIHVDVQPHVRIDARQIRDLVLARIQPGQPLSLRDVDHALMLMDELAGVGVSASFAPSQTEGATDLVVMVGGGKTVDMQLSRDNHGARSTGQNRLSLQFNFNSVLGMGDLLGLSLVDTEGSNFRRASWSLPLGKQGIRWGVHSSDMRYAFVWNGMPLAGSASATGLDLSAPWLRSPTQRWSWSLTTDHKRLQNRANDAVTSDYAIDVARAGLNGSWQDVRFGPAQSSVAITLSSGEVKNSADTTGVKGHFNKLNLAFNREQSLTGSLSWYVQAQTQSASRNLDSSEKLFLGGASGVRAYPANEVGGATGHATTLGLRQRLGNGLTLVAFADWGRVSMCRDQLAACLRDKAAGGKEAAVQSLQGHGLTLTWHTEPGLDFAATWSRRRGHHPNPDVNGLDSDQTRVIDRLWLSATVRF